MLPPEIPESAACRADYLGLDAQIGSAGVRNAGAHRIDGFPYLRSDRFLASFRDEAADGPRFEAWVERLRQLDLESRASELRNLGWEHPEEELAHVDRCGRQWAERDLADPRRRAQLRDNVEVPDDYSLLKRTLGLYPLAVPFLNLGINGFNKHVKAEYAQPLDALKAAGSLVRWDPQPLATVSLPAKPDALGIPVLTEVQWQSLAARHAPRWLVETAGEFDRVGAPVLKKGEPALDLSHPVTYFLPTYTRFAGKVLPQLVYVVWFSERPKMKWLDSYAGALDGLVWRVTLDTDGEPLIYDTIHPCGCYHYYFPAKALARKPQGSFWDEPVLVPQQAPAEPFAIRIESGTHYVRRLVPLAEAKAAEVHDYAYADYADLLSLEDGPRRRSLFCEDGLVCGTERFERFWLWPAGIDSAGAMRQWGRHATSFVGRSHFDDPAMLDRLFYLGTDS